MVPATFFLKVDRLLLQVCWSSESLHNAFLAALYFEASGEIWGPECMWRPHHEQLGACLRNDELKEEV